MMVAVDRKTFAEPFDRGFRDHLNRISRINLSGNGITKSVTAMATCYSFSVNTMVKIRI